MTITVAAIAAATALALTPAAPAPTVEPWESMRRVQSPSSVWTLATSSGYWLYGDSITVGNGAALARTIYARTGRQTAIDANSGIPTRPAVDRLAERVAQRGAPRVLIMATGANDAVDTGRAAGMAAQVARVRRIVGPTTRIVWVTTLVARPRYAAADAAGTGRVNAAIHADRTLNGVVAWDAALRRAGVMANTRDGVHPVGKGVNLWVGTVAKAAS